MTCLGVWLVLKEKYMVGNTHRVYDYNHKKIKRPRQGYVYKHNHSRRVNRPRQDYE